MDSYIVHFDRRPGATATSQATGIVEDMKNGIKNPFRNTQELLLLLGQFDCRNYPWQQKQRVAGGAHARPGINKQSRR